MEYGVTAVMLPELTFDQQIELCVKLGVKYYQYRPRIIAENQRDQPYTNWGNHKFDLTPERFVKEGQAMTAKLRDNGLEPWGAVFNCQVDMPDDVLKEMVEGVLAADAKCMRCQPPNYPRGPFNYEEYLEKTIERYQYVVDHISGPHHVKLILETHQGCAVTSPGLTYNVLKEFSHFHMGAIFDLPNYAKEGGVNEWLAVAVLKKWIDCLHFGGAEIKDFGRDELGCKTVEYIFSPMEDSVLHGPSWLKALKDSGVDVPIIIEDYDPRVDGTTRLTRTVEYLNRILPTLD